jgi:hypothetical protein
VVLADLGAQGARSSDPVSGDLVYCIRRGAQALYDDACSTMYRTRTGSDENQIREWLDAEERAERHEAVLNLLGPDDVDISPAIDVAGRHATAVREALARYARDFPHDPRRRQIQVLRRQAGQKKRLRDRLRRPAQP